ncbi:hypothetical protein [Nocardioides panzhihuensis]|uniref:FtsH-binding integral membrane protein n=1 Tax=Nocardioides panzhihuensis TaxID=860243 RepID=A0A7Z0DPL8_9ACTN|nr:hypothetical protein [Nocardioides panzhihuensis]NYI79436.1 FtsH-binding integral membrane protein [Nocardioides panzhihuensis]
MAGRVWICFWAFLRAWLFGVVLGLVTGGVFGTLLVPVVGTVFGGVLGVGMGAIMGLPFAVLVAPVSLVPTSVVADRIWPAVVAAVLAFLLLSKVMFSGASLDPSGDLAIFAGLTAIAGLLTGLFGRAVTRGVRIRALRTPETFVYFAVAGTLVSAARFVMVEEWNQAGPWIALLCAFVGFVGGGILGLVLIGYNLLVTKEPAAE